jgi:transcription termination factor Rho
MNNQFNKNNLEKLGIFELRNLARDIGVHSPTIYKKKEIIEKILDIINGKVEPYTAKTKQGRPPKSISSVNNILDIFIPKNEQAVKNERYINDYSKLTNLSSLSAMETNANINYNTTNDEKVSAILQVFKEGYGYCYTKGYHTNEITENFFVSNTLIDNFKLRTGDIIQGYVKKISEDKPLVMYKIEKINNIDSQKFDKSRQHFCSLKAFNPTQKIIFDEQNNSLNTAYFNKFLPIGKGQRAIFVLSKNTDYSNLIKGFLNSVSQKNNLEKQCILIDERPEDITEYTQDLKNTKVISTNVDDAPFQANQNIEIAVERAKRKVEQGKDILLFISNLNRLQNLYKKQIASLNAASTEQVEINSLTMVRKILSFARNTKTAGSLTIVSIVEKNSNSEFVSDLKELCNMQIYIDEKNYPKQNKLWFDILCSETRKMQLLTNEKEYEFIKKFKEDLNKENVQQKTKELEQKLLNNSN